MCDLSGQSVVVFASQFRDTSQCSGLFLSPPNTVALWRLPTGQHVVSSDVWMYTLSEIPCNLVAEHSSVECETFGVHRTSSVV